MRPLPVLTMLLIALFLGSALGCSKSDPLENAPRIKGRSLPPPPPPK